LTIGQIEVLTTHGQKREVERMKFEAGIHGAKVDGGASDQKKEDPMTYVSPKYRDCVPGDPRTYEHLTKEERKEWSEQLRMEHKRFIGTVLH